MKTGFYCMYNVFVIKDRKQNYLIFLFFANKSFNKKNQLFGYVYVNFDKG